MKIKEIIAALEHWAPRSLQEDYDNCGLQVGDREAEVDSALICLDCTEAIVLEAVAKNRTLIISHHPLIFKGLKSLSGGGYVERTLLLAIQKGIAIYSIHTNADNVIDGVNGEIAARLGLRPISVLDPKPGQLRKLVVFVPVDHAERLRSALFSAGGGSIGAYDECSFGLEGAGTFRPGPGTDPFVGEQGKRHQENEIRLEVIFRTAAEAAVLGAMRKVHPYEEIAYDIYPLLNSDLSIGAGLIGEWDEPLEEKVLLGKLKQVFQLKAIRHTALLEKPIKRLALCGGSGAFLLKKAIAAGADAYITGDVKYHEFFDADKRLLLIDIGHYGSEQYTMNLVQRLLQEKFPTFAVRLAATVTDPIYHY
ncbi:MAG: Nif3-like dinuclear metal center hexameric protein [Bacteroidota bacterium]|nr:Nif3-like dinuclear metal center hexameric protein [Bacteroidota bacterium]